MKNFYRRNVLGFFLKKKTPNKTNQTKTKKQSPPKTQTQTQPKEPKNQINQKNNLELSPRKIETLGTRQKSLYPGEGKQNWQKVFSSENVNFVSEDDDEL